MTFLELSIYLFGHIAIAVKTSSRENFIDEYTNGASRGLSLYYIRILKGNDFYSLRVLEIEYLINGAKSTWIDEFLITYNQLTRSLG